MKLTKKILLCVLCALILCVSFGAHTLAVDLTRACSLTVLYAGDGVPFAGLDIEIFRMGTLGDDGVYTTAGDFASYPVDISHVTTQAEWHAIADTLASYALTDGLNPTAAGKTDENGEATFAQLEAGMYLVLAEQHLYGDTMYLFENFLVALPSPDENGEPQYDIKAIPKHDQYKPSPEDVTYKVIKQWKDGDGTARPDSVTAEIYKDGALQTTQVLSGENNWSYTWNAPDDGAIWSVKEPNVPHGYTVTAEQNGATFVLTNHQKLSDDSSDETSDPQTGDTAVLWPYVLMMFFAGAVLATVATRCRRVDE